MKNIYYRVRWIDLWPVSSSSASNITVCVLERKRLCYLLPCGHSWHSVTLHNLTPATDASIFQFLPSYERDIPHFTLNKDCFRSLLSVIPRSTARLWSSDGCRWTARSRCSQQDWEIHVKTIKCVTGRRNQMGQWSLHLFLISVCLFTALNSLMGKTLVYSMYTVHAKASVPPSAMVRFSSIQLNEFQLWNHSKCDLWQHIQKPLTSVCVCTKSSEL